MDSFSFLFIAVLALVVGSFALKELQLLHHAAEPGHI